MGRKSRRAQSQPILHGTAVLYAAEIDDNVGGPPPAVAVHQASGTWGVAMNLTNSIVGAGVIAIPHAMADGGFAPVLCLLLLGAALTMYSMNVIVRLGDVYNVDTYENLAKAAFGPRGYLVVCFFQFTFSFGANCSYLTVVGDTVPPLIGHVLHLPFQHGHPVLSASAPTWLRILTDRDLSVMAIALLLLLPLCLQRDFASLAKCSGLSIAGMVICAGCLVYKCITEADRLPFVDDSGVFYDYIAVHRKIFPAIGTIAFAYVCQHQTYLVYNTMLDKSPAHFRKVAKWSVGASFVLIVLFGVPGYLMFLKHTRSDIFVNFTDTSDHVIQVCRVITVLSMVLTYPQEFMVARYTLQILLDHKDNDAASLFVEQEKGQVVSLRPCHARIAAFSLRWHVFFTMSLLAATVLIALVDPHLGDITSLTGSFSAVALAFVLPAACHLKLGVPLESYSRWHDCILPWLALAFGAIAFVVSTTTSIINILQETSEVNL
ncbi:hypothetical protein SPRG_00960 [Saprolegnia parasitica CBS 223.65]|uniref:Amino acid transporter transmembrane domain-containing protein n=1 Tax=Saprolegnia parasitica (strain CBS 223.65) TaxID=695850 RepID=A0A067D8A5_SAPPC|nr:hypothetical protein SPRG_00960 [Saprolegnia parasitica CBS 223.65]KDO34901.1 hypothetical protein SPRG_00960 [Saprolegnia parasitica CBS 223.65]|eukprot:XP_012194560.1 hypothetical protein SPRG_00960 [Saprolegnia parasitica CBS 223.65]